MAHYISDSSSERISTLCRNDDSEFREFYPDLAPAVEALRADCPEAMKVDTVAQFVAMVCAALSRREEAPRRSRDLVTSERLIARLAAVRERFLKDHLSVLIEFKANKHPHRFDLTLAHKAAMMRVNGEERDKFRWGFAHLLIATGCY